MANVFNRVEAVVPAVRLALEVCPLEVRPHEAERHLERVICHTRISKNVYCLYKASLPLDVKKKGELHPYLLTS